MRNLFSEAEGRVFASGHPDLPLELALRIYTSRLLGGQSELVLHGGGNTSVKLAAEDVTGRSLDVLYMKGSGIDMASIDAKGFTALELAALKRLRTLKVLPDNEMSNQLIVNKIRAEAADPSVDTLVHAFLPHKYVDHTHADSILILTNQKHGRELIKEALGPGAIVLPYAHPGFPLAMGAARLYEQDPDAEAVVVMGHGIFFFLSEAKFAYERVVEYVTRAEKFTEERVSRLATPVVQADPLMDNARAARFNQTLRGACAHLTKDGGIRRFYVDLRSGDELAVASLAPEMPEICRSGALTPDHVIRTKNQAVFLSRLPDDDDGLKKTIDEAIQAFSIEYEKYFSRHIENRPDTIERLDPYPRVFWVEGLGLAALGFTRKAARVAADIAERTALAKLESRFLGEYASIAEEHIFDMEYWGLQQKKLDRRTQPLAGQAALVTGGGGAIGLGVADRLLAAGAAVAVADFDEARLEAAHDILTDRYGKDQVEAIAFDVTDYQAVTRAFDDISLRFGGLDLVVPNAGVAHVASIEDLDPGKFDAVLAVNLGGTFNVIKAAIPIFKRQATGGNVVIISSKNVFDPGASFGAYSASKAAAHQIGKIAALELAGLAVRVNMINPDAVFGCGEVTSGLWDLVGPDRMRCRGLDPSCMQDYYRERNLLKAQVTAEHVGNAVVFFAGNFTPTTGATLPVDGGVQGAFPR